MKSQIILPWDIDSLTEGGEMQARDHLDKEMSQHLKAPQFLRSEHWTSPEMGSWVEAH